MADSDRRRFFATASILAIVLLALSTPAAVGQDDPFAARTSPSTAPNAVLVNGNPPLTEGMVDLFTNSQAWVLEIRFTPEERNKVRATLIEDWKNPAQMQDDVALLSVASQIAQQTPGERAFVLCTLQPKILETLRARKNDPYNRWVLAAYDQAHRPIAPGNPPLTESMVSRFSAFIGWLLDIPLSPSEQASQRAMLLEDWKKPKDRKADMNMLNWQMDMAGRIPEERDYIRTQVQPKMLDAMRGGNRDEQMLVLIYYQTHLPIAHGEPPLTRQAADALTEFLCFTRKQGGGPPLDCTQALKDGYAQQFAQTYGTLSAEQRKKVAEMPQTWALLRVAWAKGSEADRHQMRAQWQPAAQAGPPADRWTEAHAAVARYEAFIKKDANTVSEQELLGAAQDCDTVARELRREGGEQNLKNAPTWEQGARNLRAGKAAWVQQAAQQNAQAQANNQILLMVQLRNQQTYNQQLRQSLDTINMNDNINMKNIAGHINDSPYHYENRNGQVVRVPNP